MLSKRAVNLNIIVAFKTNCLTLFSLSPLFRSWHSKLKPLLQVRYRYRSKAISKRRVVLSVVLSAHLSYLRTVAPIDRKKQVAQNEEQGDQLLSPDKPFRYRIVLASKNLVRFLFLLPYRTSSFIQGWQALSLIPNRSIYFPLPVVARLNLSFHSGELTPVSLLLRSLVLYLSSASFSYSGNQESRSYSWLSSNLCCCPEVAAFTLDPDTAVGWELIESLL